MNSLPSRSSISPFRKSVNFNTLNDRSSSSKSTKRQSLKIITSPDEVQQQQQQQQQSSSNVSSPSKVRQRLSSFFRTSSPVVMTLKETFNNKRASLSTLSFSAQLSEEDITPKSTTSTQPMEPMDDSHSTTTTLSSDSSDHMPASPADVRTLFSSVNAQPTVWQPSVTILSYENNDNKAQQPADVNENEIGYQKPHFARTKTSSSLAFQVHQILGSTLDEVDEEIDKDWENSRDMLHQSLVSAGGRKHHLNF
ncbi:unnamed protein product [Mucor hiemalis]